MNIILYIVFLKINYLQLAKPIIYTAITVTCLAMLCVSLSLLQSEGKDIVIVWKCFLVLNLSNDMPVSITTGIHVQVSTEKVYVVVFTDFLFIKLKRNWMLIVFNRFSGSQWQHGF